MGIRTLLRRTAPGVALPPVPVFAAAASTARIPVAFVTVLRHTTADLRRRLADGWRPTDLTDRSDRPGRTDRTGGIGSTGGTDSAGRTGGDDRPGRTDRDDHPGRAGSAARAGRTPAVPRPGLPGGGRAARQMLADLARGYLTLVLTLLPRPRPAHTVTVFIAPADTLSARPDDSAPHRGGRHPRGPEPDATA